MNKISFAKLVLKLQTQDSGGNFTTEAQRTHRSTEKLRDFSFLRAVAKGFGRAPTP